MMLRLLSAIAALCLMSYIAIAVVRINNSGSDEVCPEMLISIRSRNDKPSIIEADVVASLKRAGLYPVGRPLNTVNTDKIEFEAMRNGLAAEAEAYKTPRGSVKLILTEKTPVIRIITSSDSYYIDSRGSVMPANLKYAAHVPVAGGNVEKGLATSELYEFALYLQKHEFWNNQIEQIFIRPDREVELIPRVGNHRIILGSFDRFEEKLNHLKLFYEQAIPKMGWEKYSNINLKYKNQIVCTKNKGL
jgi:cell division protein FtsQ